MPRPGHVLMALALASLASLAQAEEPGVIKARLALDKLERKLSVQPPGDVGAANKLIAGINKAKQHLMTAKDRAAAPWQAQAKRAQDFDAKVRARLGGGDGKVVAADPYAKAGAKEVAAVAAALPGLAAGDVAAGNKLIRKLNAAKKTLSRSNARAAKAWQDAARQANELDAAVRARLKERPTGGSKTPAGVTPEAKATGTAKAPAKAAARLGTDDNYKFRRDFAQRFPGYLRDLESMHPRKLAAAHVVRGKKEIAQKMRDNLRKLSAAAQQHPKLIDAYAKLDAYEQLVDEKAAEGTRLAGEAQAAAGAAQAAAEKELAAIAALHDAKTYECELERPWSPTRVEEWGARLKADQAKLAQAKARLAKFPTAHPGYTKLQGYGKLVGALKRRAAAKIQGCIGALADWEQVGSNSRRQGVWPSAIESTRRTTAKEYRTERNLANDSWQEKTLRNLGEAIQAARAMDAFSRGYHGKPSAEHRAAAEEFVAIRKEIEGAMAKVLAETRMPADKGGSGLKDIATGAITRAKWGGDHKRMVVNVGKSHHEEPKSESRIDGDVKRTWTWTEIWDQFQVCRAEEVDGDLRLVYYTIKKITQGPPWKKLGKWYVGGRVVSRRILPENVGG